MADEVVIRLAAQSAALEASIARLQKSLVGLETGSLRTNAAMTTGAARTSKVFNEQNSSFTLMAAKFALVAFAVQTMANIFQNTFGAILKNIDDFNVAAIATAAAVTGISKEGRGVEAFNQNLNAARATFKELEIVAAKFFSTGQELQLAFNTLAQRGVVIRQDEFEVLGKITDQIKLLTSGQNAQIQIQQELRAILDGNVRTTTAFGKALQARGVDIAQLSREVRATGSLKPFEPFLNGLDAAGPAIRRTLRSVLATFDSLFKILQRDIFQNTFDGIVEDITKVNNFIIDQRDLIIQVGIFIKNEISEAWQGVVGILDTISATILRIIQNDLGQFGIAIALITKLMKSGPLGILLGIAGAFTAATGDLSTFGHIINIVVNAFSLGIEFILRGLDLIITKIGQMFEQAKAFVAGGILSDGAALQSDIKGLQEAEDKVNNLTLALQILQNRSTRLFEIDDRSDAQSQQLKKTLEQIVALTRELSQATAEVGVIETEIRGTGKGAEFIRNRTSGIGADLQENLADFIQGVSEASDQVAGDLLSTTKDETDKLLQSLLDLAKGTKIPGRSTGLFTGTEDPVISDNRIDQAELKRLRQRSGAEIALQNQNRKLRLDQEIAAINVEGEARRLTATETFDRIAAARDAFNDESLKAIQAQIDLIEKRATLDVDILNEQLKATEGLTKLQQDEATLQIIAKIAKKESDIAQLRKQANAVAAEAGTRELDNVQKIEASRRRIARLIEDQQFATNRFFGSETNQQRAERAQIQAERSTSDFQAENPGATNQQVIDQATFANLQRIFETFSTQIGAIVGAVDKTFDALTDALLTGSFEFKELGQNIARDLIKAGLEGIINQIKEQVVKGLTTVFEQVGQTIGQALTLAVGLVLAVISRVGNDGDFTATGGTSGGGIQSSAQTRGLIGGSTALPIAEINNGLMEAMIPTNALLTQIERNTRVGAAANLDLDPAALQDALNNSLNQIFQQAILQNGP